MCESYVFMKFLKVRVYDVWFGLNSRARFRRNEVQIRNQYEKLSRKVLPFLISGIFGGALPWERPRKTTGERISGVCMSM